MTPAWENLVERFRDLPDLLGGHLIISVSALATGAAISLPLGVFSAGSKRFSGIALTLAATIQTVPSLALLALMVPLIGGIIGFVPAYIALVLYSVLPMLRNTITGVQGTDPDLVEAARGVGMTEMQALWRVRLPLAAPVIVAGIRTATVWVVGMATLATAVGAPGLGNYIFMGLQTRNHIATLFGCFFAALLAIVLDQLIRVLERGLRERRSRLVSTSVVALALLVLLGFLPTILGRFATSEGPRGGAEFTESGRPEGTRPLEGRRIVTGSKPFTESYILAELLARQLEAAGADVDNRPNMGSSILFDALSKNSVDCYIDYSGTIWATVMKRDEAASRLEVQIEVAKHGIGSQGPLLVAIGNLYPVKDHASLIRAVAMLPGVQLAIAGRGQEQDALRRLSVELGTADRVHLLGLRDDVERILRAADVFVQPSRAEGLPLYRVRVPSM